MAWTRTFHWKVRVQHEDREGKVRVQHGKVRVQHEDREGEVRVWHEDNTCIPPTTLTQI